MLPAQPPASIICMIRFHPIPKTNNQLYLPSSIIISFMKAASQAEQQQFHQRLLFQSMTTVINGSQPLPLYKLAIRPYDYYIQYTFEAPIARLHFYQELSSFSSLIVSPEHVSLAQISESYFQRWFGLAEKNRFSISCFLKYYNYTIRSWIDHQRNCSSVISEQEILMVLRQLLNFHKFYQQYYHQNCGIFRAELIYITPEKSLRIYPHSIQYNGQISVHKEQQSYLNLSMVKLEKQGSVQTTINNSQAHIQITSSTESDDNTIHPDLRDIFILVMQLISLKKYEYFYSQKHSMIIWDAVNCQLNSIKASHLSQQFINFLKGCALIKNFDCAGLLSQVERMIGQKQRMCKTIHIAKNQQLVQLVLKRIQTQKNKSLEDLKFAKSEKQQRMVSRFHSY